MGTGISSVWSSNTVTVTEFWAWFRSSRDLHLVLHDPSITSLTKAGGGFHVVQLVPPLVTACFARMRFRTLSTVSRFVVFVFTQLTCEKTRSTAAEECGRIVR